MNEFKLNNEMELLLQARQDQPEMFAQLPATTKMALGLYQDSKNTPAASDLPAAKNELKALKTRSESTNLTPSERISLGYEISILEEKINDTNTNK